MMDLILIVDDDHDLRSMLAQILSDDFEVREAEDGRRALEAIRAHSPKLVLLDVSMPGLSGLDVLALARRDSPKTRFVMLTSHQELELAREALGLGAVEYVTKPFDAAYIKEEVSRLLEPPPSSDGRPWKVAS